ncbi:MAG: hypothetical protein EOO77_12450 [Oxalobacteraceae bacterium]|nr:MAG: hypothetical protein EOO77_12450 [Oxalobacteraceae bacterium]
MNTAVGGFVLHNRSWGERICSRMFKQPKDMPMLRRSNDVREVSMFSLIALYFEYRNVQAAHIAATGGAAEPRPPANDVSSAGIAKAA